MTLNARVGEVTERIVKRSRDSRRRYLDRIEAARQSQPERRKLGCANLAHAFAACAPGDKLALILAQLIDFHLLAGFLGGATQLLHLLHGEIHGSANLPLKAEGKLFPASLHSRQKGRTHLKGLRQIHQAPAFIEAQLS